MMLANNLLMAAASLMLQSENFQLFYSRENLLLHINRCQACTVLPYEYHPLVDPGKSRTHVSPKMFEMMVRQCSKNKATNVLNAFLRRSSKWCGNQGDKAVRQCCHERSSCPLKLKRNQMKDNVKNQHPFTINDCNCELKFAKCLKRVGNNEAQQVFKYFFEVFSSSCLTYDHPFTCNNQKKNGRTCTKNKKKPQKWQIRKLSNLKT
uniref:Phospholipase A2 n=1 Tax=Sepia latimanus TaxID=3248881 RepID=B6Z1Y5_SEPLA|nr:phospholipase A2 [Sepia latimanus]